MIVFSGLVLPHDHLGSHLNNRHQTVNEELEVANFAYAGKILGEIWSSINIDNHPVVAEYINPETIEPIENLKDRAWYDIHVRESQYFLQIVKCDDRNCCGPRRSSLWDLLPDGFLPPPYPISQSSEGLTVPNVNTKNKFSSLLLRLSLKTKPACKNFKQIPYDYFCPSIKSNLSQRICNICGLYHASCKSKDLHIKETHKKSSVPVPKLRPVRVAAKRARELMIILKDKETGAEDSEWVDESEVDCDFSSTIQENDQSNSFPVIESIQNFMKNPWQEEKEK